MRRAPWWVLALCLAHGQASAQAQAQPLDRWLGDLSSPTPSTYRVATAYVAHAGPAGLDSLAAWLPNASPEFWAHARIVVAAALLTSVTPDDLARRPKLRALGKDDLAAADHLAAALCASHELEHGIGALSDSTRADQSALVALGGWAVPAAVALTHCRGATGRVIGLRVLTELRAGGQRAALDALVGDSTIVIASEEEQQGRVTVGELASEYARGFPFSNHDPAIAGTASNEGEEYLNAVMRAERLDESLRLGVGLAEPEWSIDNRLRIDAHTDGAATWDAYWDRARPVLVMLWEGRYR